MRRLTVAAAALLSAWNSVCAQAGGDSTRQSLTISLGALREDRRDDADSPLAYGGAGPGARIEYDSWRAKRHWHVSFSGGGAQLTPLASVQGDTPLKESFGLFALDGGMDWRVGKGSARAGEFAVGFDFAVTTTLVVHSYPNQEVTEQNFDFGAATIAPVARWTLRLFGGELQASLAVPLAAWVDHPYADVRFASQFSSVHFAPLSTFHEASGGLSYAFATMRSVGFTASYRLDMIELNELERVHRVSQSLSLGVVKRFGSWR